MESRPKLVLTLALKGNEIFYTFNLAEKDIVLFAESNRADEIFVL